MAYPAKGRLNEMSETIPPAQKGGAHLLTAGPRPHVKIDLAAAPGLCINTVVGTVGDHLLRLFERICRKRHQPEQ